MQPWEYETDYVQFMHAGLKCRVQRGRGKIAHLCGYVLLPLNHKRAYITNEDSSLDIHGGVTYAQELNEMTGKSWAVGFDTAHYFDYSPSLFPIGKSEDYKSLPWVIRETCRLAEMLSDEHS